MQAPQPPSKHINFVPLRCAYSLIYVFSEVYAGILSETEYSFPLIVNVTCAPRYLKINTVNFHLIVIKINQYILIIFLILIAPEC